MNQEVAILGMCVRSSTFSRLEANRRTETNTSSVVAPTLDLTQAGKEVTSPKSTAKGGLLHGVSGISMKSVRRMLGKAVVKQFRPSRVAKRFVQERDKKGHMLGITQ